MTGLVIEGGLYFLVLFAPFAFGGVELWAQGVIQIVAGLVVAAWVQDYRNQGGAGWIRGFAERAGAPWSLILLRAAIVLFLLFVVLTVVPMPAGWIRILSPDTHDLYARTVPGFLEGEPFEPASLPGWLLADAGGQIPAFSSDSPPGEGDVKKPPMAASSFSAAVSPWRTLSIKPYETWNRLSQLICYVGLFAVVVGHFRSRERLGRLLGMIAFSGFAVSMFGMIQKLTWNGKLYWIREGQYVNLSPFGPFVNRNNYAAFAGAAFPIALCAALGFLRQRQKGRPGALPRLFLWGFAAAVMVVGIFLSLSRGGIICSALSLAVVAGMLLYYGRGGRELAVLGAVSIAAAGFLWWIGPEKVIERVGTLAEGQSVPSISGRIETWERATGLLARNQLTGTGLGTFAFAFMRDSPPGEGWWTTAHNEYLELLCDTGFTGGALFLVGLGSWLALVARPGLFVGRSDRHAYMGIVAGIAGLLLHSAISSNLQVPANAVLLAVLGGALIALVAAQESSRA